MSEGSHSSHSSCYEDWAWRIGMFILSWVPAIIGGGIVWGFFPNWTAVILWEVILVFILVTLIDKKGKSEPEHH